MNERLKSIRKFHHLTQSEFGERIGLTRDAVANLELGRIDIKDIHVNIICREFSINEDWLRTGSGEMFSLPEDEDAQIVSSLLFESNNPFTDLIKSIMKTYSQLDPKGQQVIREFAESLAENISHDKTEE